MEEMLVTSHEEAHNIEAKIVILGEQSQFEFFNPFHFEILCNKRSICVKM